MSDTKVAVRPYIVGPSATSFITPAGGGAGFAFISSEFVRAQSGPGTTPAIDTTGANLIVIGLSYHQTGSPTLADNKGNGAPTALTATDGGGPVIRIYYWYAPTVGTGHTFTVSGTDVYSTLIVAAFSGSAASPFEAEVGGSGTSTAPSAGAGLTPALSGELVIAATGFGAGASPIAATNISAPFTFQETGGYANNSFIGGALGYSIQTSAILADPDFTLDTSTLWAARLACFKAA